MRERERVFFFFFFFRTTTLSNFMSLLYIKIQVISTDKVSNDLIRNYQKTQSSEANQRHKLKLYKIK